MADKHRFYAWPWEHGRWVPSVTTVCGIVKGSGLERWKMREAIRAAAPDIVQWDGFEAFDTFAEGRMNGWLAAVDEASAEARQIGTDTHHLIELMHKGYAWHEAADAHDPLVFQLAQAYSDWYAESVSRVVMAEQVVYGADGAHYYAGTLDLACELEPGAIIYRSDRRTVRARRRAQAIVDIKTSGDFYPDMAAQLAGYADSIEIYNWLRGRPDYLITVRLDKESQKFYVRHWEYGPSLSMFLSALNLWYLLNPRACENYGKRVSRTGVP